MVSYEVRPLEHWVRGGRGDMGKGQRSNDNLHRRPTRVCRSDSQHTSTPCSFVADNGLKRKVDCYIDFKSIMYFFGANNTHIPYTTLEKYIVLYDGVCLVDGKLREVV